MDFRFTPSDDALKQDVADFVKKEWDPGSFDHGSISWNHVNEEADAITGEFKKKLVDKGWWTMHWPVEHGGQGVNIGTQLAYREAMAYAGAPQAVGGGLVAPVLMVIGQDWQKKEFLPQIAKADIEFSQGFSEPNAGSDLAGLQTRAVRDGDDYVLNGQKIWGTYRNKWMHIMVRTDPDAPKHRGISYLLAQLKDDDGGYFPGVTVRAIPDALGRHRWDELFMDNFRVPARNIIGEENRGWYAAMTTLSFERSNIEASATLTRIMEDYIEYCRRLTRRGRSSPLDSEVFRNELADLRVEIETLRTLSYRVAWMQSNGDIPQKESSMTKLWGDSLDQKVYKRLSWGLKDYGALLPGNTIQTPEDGILNWRGYSHLVVTIYGGTNEIQKNIIAQRGLGLPR
ncbi:MAG: acyl-CoA dehydrogenase family protein [Dehalococcoidia bacterium]|jgi:alkylation response protein AidB-like acyl-CoA dehydrogenase|nr:acyl-CoA dehydrogenase family protein [Dehalococcoidia bacterium]